MAYEQKDMNGALFRNDRKEKDTHPDYTGSCKIGGVDHWISGWIKEANGKKYFSLAFKVKERQNKKAEGAEFKDDIPF